MYSTFTSVSPPNAMFSSFYAIDKRTYGSKLNDDVIMVTAHLLVSLLSSLKILFSLVSISLCYGKIRIKG